MTNKQFVKLFAIIIILLLSFFVYFISFHKTVYMSVEYPMWIHVKNIADNKQENKYNVLIIGDSRTKAGILPNTLDTEKIASYNLSLGGGTPLEGYYTLKRYLQTNDAPEYVLLSYSPFHLITHDTYMARTVKYHFLDILEYMEVSKHIHALDGGLGDYLSKLLETLIILYNPLNYLPEFKNGIFLKRWEDNEHIYEYLLNSKGHYYFGQSEKAEGYNAESASHVKVFKCAPLLNDYLVKLIDLAKKSNIKVYWYTMPFNQSSYKILDKNFERTYNKYIQSLKLKHGVIPLNKLYYLNDENFGDPSHLYHGAKKVTKDIQLKLQKVIP